MNTIKRFTLSLLLSLVILAGISALAPQPTHNHGPGLHSIHTDQTAVFASGKQPNRTWFIEKVDGI